MEVRVAVRGRRLGGGPPRRRAAGPGRAAAGSGAAARGRGGHCQAARAGRRAPGGRRAGRGGGRHRDRPGAVGPGVGRGGLPGVPGQPPAGGALPGAAPHLRGQERRWGRARAGRHGAHRPPPAPRGSRRQRPGRGDQAAGPGAPDADLGAADALALLAAAPDPASAARLPRPQVVAALTRAGRRGVPAKAEKVQQALRAEQLAQPKAVVAAYAATVRATVAVVGTLNAEIEALGEQVQAQFGEHPDAAIYRSQPGLGGVLGARVLGEFGDDPDRYRDARARRNYAGTSPVTKQSGKRTVVLARFARNDRLADPLHQQAFCALTASPGARAYYDQLRGRGAGHHAALRQLANRLVGILHGCLKARTRYDEATAWSHRTADAAA